MQHGRPLRTQIAHGVLLSLFALGLIVVWRKVITTPDLASIAWLSWLLVVSAILLVALFVTFIAGVRATRHLERFDPSQKASLARLERIRHFALRPAPAEAIRRWDHPLVHIGRILASAGFSESARWRHGVVYARACGGDQWERLYVCYRPMMTVLIVDGALRDVELEVKKAETRGERDRSSVLFVTDGQDREEITSAAVGVVNDHGAFNPMLLDIQFGRLFTPLDRSGVALRARLHHRALRRSLVSALTVSTTTPPVRGGAWAHERAQTSAVVRRATVTLRQPQSASPEDRPSPHRLTARRVPPSGVRPPRPRS